MAYETDSEVAEEIDDMPASLKEGMDDEEEFVAEGEDIHAAEQMERSDVIEPVKGVEMYIKSIKLDVYTPEDKEEWKLANLEPMLVVGEKGVDGKGKYKNKHFFPRILSAVNRKAYDFSVNAAGKPTRYYEPDGNGFGDYNAFLTALGFPTNPAPRNDAAFRKSLVGRKVIVDITKDRRQVKDNVTGKYVYVDEYENKLIYRGQPKQAAKADVAEAAQA
jgi:hypothetical protein